MENFDWEKFKELKQKVELEYGSIDHIYSPALKAPIFFTAEGLHHLRYDSSRAERGKRAQRNKFLYFKSAIEIIKKSNTIQEYRRRLMPVGKPDKSGLRRTKWVEWFAFFVVTSFSKPTRIKVVVRRVGVDGQYHFWSVMPFWTLHNNQRIVGSRDIEDQ